MSKEEIEKYIGKKVWYDEQGAMIFCKNQKGGDQLLLDVRGWGNLTGVGGMNLPESEAIKMLDSLGEWIADAINQKLTLQQEKR